MRLPPRLGNNAQMTLASSPSLSLPPVLLVGDHFGYPGGVSHGVTTYFRQVLPALARAGVDLTACFLREPHPAADELRDHGVSPIFLSASKWDPWVASRVARIARERRAGIVHSAGLKATIAGRIAAHAVGARAFLHVHDLHRTGNIVGTLHRLLARPNDVGICVSQGVADLTVRDYHIVPDRIRVIHNGIRLEDFLHVAPDARSRVRSQLSIAPDARVLAMVGRMHRVKGHHTMLQMMPGILRRCPDAMLVLVGDGPERNAYEALARELAVQERVLFLGQRNDVPEILRAADLFVMPSESEGLPIAAIEALASGTPIVGFDVGGMAEVVTDRRNGRVVPAADRAAFIDAVADTLEDPALLRVYSQNAVVDAQSFSIQGHVSSLLKCYAEAAG